MFACHATLCFLLCVRFVAGDDDDYMKIAHGPIKLDMSQIDTRFHPENMFGKFEVEETVHTPTDVADAFVVVKEWSFVGTGVVPVPRKYSKKETADTTPMTDRGCQPAEGTTCVLFHSSNTTTYTPEGSDTPVPCQEVYGSRPLRMLRPFETDPEDNFPVPTISDDSLYQCEAVVCTRHYDYKADVPKVKKVCRKVCRQSRWTYVVSSRYDREKCGDMYLCDGPIECVEANYFA